MWSVEDRTDKEVITLKITDTVAVAQELLIDQQLFHLPILKEDQIVGHVSLHDLEELETNQTINEIVEPSIPDTFIVQNDQHFFDALQLISANFKATSISVVDRENKFIGILRLTELVNNYIPQNYLTQEASLVIIGMDEYDYSLTTIANIVEYNRCKVLQTLTTSMADKQIWVQLIINSSTIQSILEGFERYGYGIVYAQNQQDGESLLEDRYKSLLKYLDL